ncbi:hypothetical protein C882_2917 [Caenispirillum salinarum AK4]|uniref:Transposase n=1 Tax=Caenispirillum salinarum AK4 TaxID=1238182 RepID=K9GNC9_9PROT|nr:IS200/IS605 family accessory protein TnpB-related protein [Caenispirillum salinarum]EKV26149.1 hypothetical protein C882_2917 [Caenispirillum salinarum AK4]
MMRTFGTIIRSEQAEAVLAPFAARMARARHWQFRELHIKGRPKLAVRKEAQQRFGLTKRQALANEFDLDQAVTAWRGMMRNRIDRLRDRMEQTEGHIARLERKMAGAPPALRASLKMRCHQKKRHVGRCRDTMAACQKTLEGPPALCFGGRDLLRQGAVEAWRDKRQGRFLLVGSKDETAGNQTAQYDPYNGRLVLRLSDADAETARAAGAPVDRRGRVVFENVVFRYGQQDLANAAERGIGITFLFFRDDRRRWHLRATIEQPEVPKLTDIRIATVGVDLNVEHLAVVVTDRYGNPVERATVPFPVAGTDGGTAQAMIGDAVKWVCDLALRYEAGVAVEDLDFGRKKAALKTYGRKHARRLSSFAYSKFGEMIASRCGRHGIDLTRVNPAFTSVIGGVKYATGRAMSRHHAAALVIARRAQGFEERFVCMGDKALGGPGRSQPRHLWSRWRNVHLMASAGGTVPHAPRRSDDGATEDGRLEPRAGPARRRRRTATTASGHHQVRAAVARARV